MNCPLCGKEMKITEDDNEVTHYVCYDCDHCEDVWKCDCGSGKESHPEYDAQGIYLCRVCDDCRKKKLSKYRPCILEGYTQEDVDEPIEPE